MTVCQDCCTLPGPGPHSWNWPVARFWSGNGGSSSLMTPAFPRPLPPRLRASRGSSPARNARLYMASPWCCWSGQMGRSASRWVCACGTRAAPRSMRSPWSCSATPAIACAVVLPMSCLTPGILQRCCSSAFTTIGGVSCAASRSIAGSMGTRFATIDGILSGRKAAG